MTRPGGRMLLVSVVVCVVGLITVTWLWIPTILFGSTGVTESNRATASARLQEATTQYHGACAMVDIVRRTADDEVTGAGYGGVSGVPGLSGADLRARMEQESTDAPLGLAAAAQRAMSAADDSQRSLENRYRQQAISVSPIRATVLLGGVAVLVSVLGGAAARRHGAGAATNRLLLRAEHAEDLASWVYEMRAADAGMTRRQRWRNRCSLPALWCHTAVRAWTELIRALVRSRIG